MFADDVKFALICLALFASTCVYCSVSEAAEFDVELVALRAEIALLQSRVDALELEKVQQRDEPPLSIAVNNSLSDGSSVRVTGDFRYRFERINAEGSDNRQRSRIRARTAITMDASEHLELGFGLATGGDSPISSTQTLGEGGSKKPVALDLAYVEWRPLESISVMAGKFRNPLFRVPSHGLLWDDEWRPEGLGIVFENDRYFASILGTWLESDSAAEHRLWATGVQAGIHAPFGQAVLTVGTGFIDFGTAGKGPFFGPDDSFAGNSVQCLGAVAGSDCRYAFDYQQLDFYASVDWDVGGVRSTVYAHGVQNLAASDFDTGWMGGVRIRSTYQSHAMQYDYFYQDLGADAVYGQLTNSDFGGGGTDVAGHYVKAALLLDPKWSLSATYFLNEIGADVDTSRDYERLQLNVDFSY